MQKPVVAFCISALLLLMPQIAQAQGGPASVLVENVEVQPIADTAPVLGQLVGSTQANVASRRAGVADEVLFAIGDRVDAGQPLVRLDTTLTLIEQRTVAADLAVAEAGIQAAEARVALAQQGLARMERLKGSTAFSAGLYEDLIQNVQEAQGQLAQATAQIHAAEARMARIDYELEHALIRAPYAGVVIERSAEPGQWLSLGQAVAKLLDVDGLEIQADIPVELIAGLAPSTEVSMRLADGVTGGARVRAVLPIETVTTRTRPVRFTIDLSDANPLLVAVGKSVTLQIPVSAPRDAITVPKDALVQGAGGGWIVFVVSEDKAQPRPVQIGQAVGGRMEVLSGLETGDIVVVRGNERLRPGQSVNPSPAGG